MALRVALSYILLGGLALLGHCPQAFSQEAVASALFEDCEEARKNFQSLSPPEQQRTFEFLTRVIALNTQARPSGGEVFSALPGQAVGPHLGSSIGRDPLTGHVWQATDAKRELRAKRCALELFLTAGPAALSALPALIKTYSEQNLSDEVAVALEETAANVAEAGHRAGLVPSESDLTIVAPYLTSDHPLLAQNYLGEFPTLALPVVVRTLSRCPTDKCEAVLATLRQLDPDGTRGARTFLELSRSLTPEETIKLFDILPLPGSAEGLRPYATELARLASAPALHTSLTPLLGRICSRLNILAFEPAVVTELAPQIANNQLYSLPTEEQECLVKKLSTLAGPIAADLNSSDEALQVKAFSLLKAAAPNLIGDTRTVVFNRLKELGTTGSQATSPLAIEALGLFTDKRQEALTYLYTTLKAAFTKTAPNAAMSPATTAAALKSVASIGLGKEAPRFTPILISSVNTGIGFEATRTIAKSHQTLEPELLALLSRSSPDAVSRALTILGDRPTLSAKAIQPLVDLLKTGAHNGDILTALSKVGAAATTPVRKTLTKAPVPRKIIALGALVLLQSASKQETAELLTLLNAQSCAQLPPHPPLYAALVSKKDLDRAPVESLITSIGRCLPDLSEQLALNMMAAIPQAIPKSCTAATERLSAKTLPDGIASGLTERFIASGECPAFVESLFTKGTEAHQKVALAQLSAAKSVAEPLLSAVRDALNSMDSSTPLFYDYAIVLARHGVQLYDWKHLLREAISSAGKNQPLEPALQEVIKLLPPAIVLDEVAPALHSDSPERVVGACHIGAGLGSQAVPIVSKLWNLRDKRTPSIRYASSLALLQINPLTPELQDALRQILVNRYYEWAVRKPIQWQQTVALVELPKAEFGTLRTVRLERLLRGH
jgi:hypothetical protein